MSRFLATIFGILLFLALPIAARSQELLATLNHSEPITGLAVSPDGKRLAVNADGKIVLWDVATRKERLTIDTLGSCAPAFTPDSKTLISAGRRSEEFGSVVTVRLWAANNGNLKGIIEEAVFRSIAISKDGQSLAVAGRPKNDGRGVQREGSIRIYDLATNKETAALTIKGDERGFVDRVAFSPMVLVWSAAWGKANCTSGISRRRKKPRFWQGHTSNVLAIAFSPDGKLIASGANGNDAGVRLYATDEGETRILEGHQVGVGALAFSPNGKTIATAGSITQCASGTWRAAKSYAFSRDTVTRSGA